MGIAIVRVQKTLLSKTSVKKLGPTAKHSCRVTSWANQTDCLNVILLQVTHVRTGRAKYECEVSAAARAAFERDT